MDTVKIDKAIMLVMTNPHDLVITVRENADGYFGFTIIRGPEDFYKSILWTHYFARTSDEAVDEIKNALEATLAAMDEYEPGREAFILEYVNAGLAVSDGFDIMDKEMVDWIVAELRTNLTASTFIA